MKIKDHHRVGLSEANRFLDEHPLSSLVIGDHQAPHTLTARLVRTRGRTLVITGPNRVSEVARQYLACNVPLFTPVTPPQPVPTQQAAEEIQGDGSVTVWPVNQLRNLPARRWRLIIIDTDHSDLQTALTYAASWRESAARGGRITVLHPPQTPQAALRWRPSRSGPLLAITWDAQAWHERLAKAAQELPEGLFKPRLRAPAPEKTVTALPVVRDEPSWKTQGAARSAPPRQIAPPTRREIPINTESDGFYPRTKKRWTPK